MEGFPVFGIPFMWDLVLVILVTVHLLWPLAQLREETNTQIFDSLAAGI